MKKLFLFLCTITCMNMLNAQEQHLEFKGITIDGPISTFVQQLEKQNFVFKEYQDGFAIMEGTFVGEDCTLLILYTPNTKTVAKVAVYLDKEYTSWYSIKSAYNKLRDVYISKYGTTTSDYRFFSSPYEDGDGYEMTAIKIDKCHYAMFYDNGISLAIATTKQIKIIYEDTINMMLYKQESSANISNDI